MVTGSAKCEPPCVEFPGDCRGPWEDLSRSPEGRPEEWRVRSISKSPEEPRSPLGSPLGEPRSPLGEVDECSECIEGSGEELGEGSRATLIRVKALLRALRKIPEPWAEEPWAEFSGEVLVGEGGSPCLTRITQQVVSSRGTLLPSANVAWQ